MLGVIRCKPLALLSRAGWAIKAPLAWMNPQTSQRPGPFASAPLDNATNENAASIIRVSICTFLFMRASTEDYARHVRLDVTQITFVARSIQRAFHARFGPGAGTPPYQRLLSARPAAEPPPYDDDTLIAHVGGREKVPCWRRDLNGVGRREEHQQTSAL
jgi:hypothetical protein